MRPPEDNDNDNSERNRDVKKVVLTHAAYPWSTARPVVVRVSLPREPWVNTAMEED